MSWYRPLCLGEMYCLINISHNQYSNKLLQKSSINRQERLLEGALHSLRTTALINKHTEAGRQSGNPHFTKDDGGQSRDREKVITKSVRKVKGKGRRSRRFGDKTKLLKWRWDEKGTDRGEDFGGLLDGGDASPLPLLEELHPGGVVKGGRRVCAEEGGEALAVGQGRRTGAIGQLGNTRQKGRKSKAVTYIEV